MAGKRRRLEMAGPRFATAEPRFAQIKKEADPVFGDERYKIWRNAVITRAEGKCEWVGQGIRCGRAEPRMFADHVVERSDGGEPFDPANGQSLCGKHHTIKTNIEKRKRAERLQSFLLGVSAVSDVDGRSGQNDRAAGVEADRSAAGECQPLRVNGDA